MDLHDLTAVEQAAAIRSGEVSSVELAEHYLLRSHALNATVGAFATITDGLAREQARAADRAVAERHGGRLSVLHGVVVPVKDLNHVAGVTCRFGSAAVEVVSDIDDDVVVLLLGCFPASVFALQELLKPTRTADKAENDYRRWMVILFWVVLILFSVVKTKIVHYSSLCYFPLTYLAALQLERVWMKREGFGWSRFVLGALGTIIALIVIAVPFIGMNIDAIKPLFAQDPFALANLDADVKWTGLEVLAGLVLFGALIAGHVLHGRQRFRASILAVFGGGALFVTTTLFFFINNIEGYS